MAAMGTDGKVVSASLDVAAPAARIFELIADPAEQPRWDGNDNLAEAAPGQRVHGVGDVFRTSILQGGVRENHVVEFEEGAADRLAPVRAGLAAARAPLAVAALTPRRRAHPRHAHLRLVPTDRRETLPPRPCHGCERTAVLADATGPDRRRDVSVSVLGECPQ